MENIKKISYSIKRFENSKDKDFLKALKIYNDSVPVDTKTSTNELIYFADNWNCQKSRLMYFLGLYIDNQIIGYVEAGYLLKTKVIIIDYIVIKEEYHLNSAFYPLFGLVQKFFSDELIDYDFIVTEVSTKSIDDIDSESFFSKKMLQLEDFRIADQVYIQPKLGIENEESNFEFQLLIRSKHALSVIKTETYISIVKDIYYEHYLAWYSAMDPDRAAEYKRHIDEQFEKIISKLSGEEVRFENCNSICQFYKSPECHYQSSSTAGFIDKSTKKNRPMLLLGIPILMLVETIFSLLLYKFIEKNNINAASFVPIFTAITTLCAAIFTISFTKIRRD